ncbi:MAG TPA: hypothetical protein VH083_23820 [Myxococcales bacterium]|jgi:hypothetical protein|nr:hypothetical protein [Myxococcales bacterium]
MAEAKPATGGFSRLVLWLLILVLLVAVWYLASERNQRHFHVIAQNGSVVIERGRFFPTGTGAPDEKAYQPIPVPAGEKAPGEMEFDDQNSLDRFLFDLASSWAQGLAKKNDTHGAAALVDRLGQLPGLTGAQVQQLNAMSADLSWDDAHTDLATALKSLDEARRKLAAVQAGKGSHAVEATALDLSLQTVQHSLDALARPPR